MNSFCVKTDKLWCCRTNPDIKASCNGLKDVCDVSTVRCSTVYPENSLGKESLWKLGNSDDDMCQMDNDDFMFGASVKCISDLHSHAKYKVQFPSVNLCRMCCCEWEN